MTQKTLRAYAMYRLSALQAEEALLKELVAGIDGQGEQSTDLADGPANGKAAKQAAERTAKNGKKPAPKVEVEETTEEEQSDDLSFLDEEAGEEAALTEDDVKVAVKKFVAAFGREKVTALLAKFKAKAIQDIKAKDYEAVIKLVNEALKKHKK